VAALRGRVLRLTGPTMSLATLADAVTEYDPVRRWRLEQLRKAGYSPWDAFVLSGRADVDLHTAIDLVLNHCPVATAVRILI